MIFSSHITLSKQAYFNNLHYIEKWAGKKTQLYLVVKGNAYGHGIAQMVNLALEYGIEKFAVFNFEEAIEVHLASNGKADIMIMGFIANNDYEEAIKKRFSFFVYNHLQLNRVLLTAESLGQTARIHLEFNTGMNRSGFQPSETALLLNLVNNNKKYLHLSGICSHLAGAESIANYVRIRQQAKVFRDIEKTAMQMGVIPENFHLSCSAATVRFPTLKFNLVRIGILQYGFWPSMEVYIEYLNKKNTSTDPLKRVISWKTQVMDLQQIKSGEYVGYGNSFLTNKSTKIAILPVGYSQGYARSLSNSGSVIINNMKVKVVGTINMNAASIDVTDLNDIQLGDEVYLIGGEGERQVSVSSFAEMSDQLNYELLTRIPSNIPRTIIK